MTTTTDTDRIERHVVINAPRERVWSALSDTKKFGVWFGCDIGDQAFTPGQRVRGLMDPRYGLDNVYFDVVTVNVEPQKLLSFHWHPYPLDKTIDYDREEPTLVTFTLADAPDGGTTMTVVESGFDKVPPSRRLEAFRMNSGGWDAQIKNVIKYVTQ
jgi:uncharacterized protein YndB with AHSA1/START domain